MLAAIVLGNVVFNAFEKHLPWWRRLLKHGLLFATVAAVRITLGGWALCYLLAVINAAQVVLHAWYFQAGV